MSYEYKVIPAPARGLKAKGLKTAEERFANALQTAINGLAADGWEYIRTDTLPCEQREGLMGKTTVYQNMLVFRRDKAEERLALQPPVAEQPVEPVFTAKKPVIVATQAEDVAVDNLADEPPRPESKPTAGGAD